MSCQEFEPLIALYIEGELPDAKQVEEHVTVCADCRELLQDLQASQAAVRQWASEPVDTALLAAVRAGVLSRIEDRRRLIWPWVAAVAMAAALIAVFLVPPRKPAAESPAPVPIAQTPPVSGGADPPVRSRRPRRRSVAVRTPPKAHVSEPTPPLVVKMFTDDPDIVIIWLVDKTGD
jgi:anti-sigma factor RsiW